MKNPLDVVGSSAIFHQQGSWLQIETHSEHDGEIRCCRKKKKENAKRNWTSARLRMMLQWSSSVSEFYATLVSYRSIKIVISARFLFLLMILCRPTVGRFVGCVHAFGRIVLLVEHESLESWEAHRKSIKYAAVGLLFQLYRFLFYL